MRKEGWVGPVADDILYAGIIAINTARTPGLAGPVGKALGLENVVLPAAAGAVGARLFASRGAAAAGGGAAAGGAAAAGVALLPVAAVTALAAGSTYAGLKLTNPKNPMWKQIVGRSIGGPVTAIYRGVQAARGK
jgi:hypothetical protein